MNQPGPRFWEIFFEVYENLPRQGPGNRTCKAAFDLDYQFFVARRTLGQAHPEMTEELEQGAQAYQLMLLKLWPAPRSATTHGTAIGETQPPEP